MHRYHNSYENSQLNSIAKNVILKEQICAENVRNTIEKYDFKMNFDLLKLKIDKLNKLKCKEEPIRKKFSPIRKNGNVAECENLFENMKKM